MESDLLSARSLSYYMIVRQLFSRLVFSLQIKPSLAMKILAFWLWLEGNGHVDFLRSVDSFDDYHLWDIAFAGKGFIEALYLKSCESNVRSMQGDYFWKEAVHGVTFYLKNICFKAVEDLREIAEKREGRITSHINQAHAEKMKDKVPMSTKDLLSKIKCCYINSLIPEEGTSSGNEQSPKSDGIQDLNDSIDGREEIYHLATLMDSLKLRDRSDNLVRQYSSVPRDERTLFVTFSNGYPFTKDELYDFFMRHYGDIEEITIEDPVESRPPLYAHITFFSQLTLFRVLDGNKKVKFMILGKHLWARQFVPKRKKHED
ncbi:hypothetical protein ACP4OV_006965 [Aristida adscensionis]